MATNGPSLSEITNIKGDADIAFGTAGVGGNDVVFKPNEGAQYLMQYAQSVAQRDYNQYKEFQDNMKNFYTDLGNIDMKDIYYRDQAELRNQYKDVLQTVADNMDVVRNPMKDPNRYATVVRAVSGLKSDVAKSAQFNKYFNEHDSFLKGNEQFASDENTALLDAAKAQSLKDRTLPTLKLSHVFDIKTASDYAMKVAEQEYANASLDPKFVRGKNYILSVRGKYYNPDVYRNAMRTYLTTHITDKNVDKTDYQVLAERYAKSPEAQTLYGSLDNYVNNTIDSTRPQNAVSQYTEEPEKYGLIAQDQANKKELLKLNEGMQLRLMAEKFKAMLQYNKDLAAEGLGGAGAVGAKDGGYLGREKNVAFATGAWGHSISPDVGQAVFGGGGTIRETSGEDDQGNKYSRNLPEYKYLNNGLYKNAADPNDKNNGKIVVNREKWDGKKYVPDQLFLTEDEFDAALNNMYGKQGRNMVDGASQKYRKAAKVNEFKADKNELADLFQMPKTGGNYWDPVTKQMYGPDGQPLIAAQPSLPETDKEGNPLWKYIGGALFPSTIISSYLAGKIKGKKQGKTYEEVTPTEGTAPVAPTLPANFGEDLEEKHFIQNLLDSGAVMGNVLGSGQVITQPITGGTGNTSTVVAPGGTANMPWLWQQPGQQGGAKK